MTSSFHRLTAQHLASLGAALQEGRLEPPFSDATVGHYVPFQMKDEIALELRELVEGGMTPKHIAFSLRLLKDEKATQQELDDRLEWVWTGPEVTGATARDTAVVIREMLRAATSSVLIASYSLDQPTNAQVLFGELAEKMDANEDLSVRLFLNVGREYKDKTAESILLRRFADRFRKELWPGERLPEVFYDPRALELDWNKRACLHAKCVIVDDRYSLVTSANFSEAAHLRNIEAGVLLDDVNRASALKKQFDALVTEKILCRMPKLC